MMKNFLYILCLFCLLGCSDSNNALLDNLKAAVETQKPDAKSYNIIKLETLTDFDWDTAYYFQEGTGKKDISNEIGFRWDGSDVPQFHHRFLFVGKGKVTGFVDYNYQELPLTVYGCNQDRWIYPRPRATFASFKYCKEDVPVYTFIPEPCMENLSELMGQKCKEEKAAK